MFLSGIQIALSPRYLLKEPQFQKELKIKQKLKYSSIDFKSDRILYEIKQFQPTNIID